MLRTSAVVALVIAAFLAGAYVTRVSQQPAVARADALVATPPPQVSDGFADTRVPVAAAYVGNTNTHRFHRHSCRYAGCTNCTARFATREEAIASGYRPGGCCNP